MKKILFIIPLLILSCSHNSTSSSLTGQDSIDSVEQSIKANKTPYSFMGIELGDSVGIIDSLKSNNNVHDLILADFYFSSSWYNSSLEDEVAEFSTAIIDASNTKETANVKIYSYKDKISKIYLCFKTDCKNILKLYLEKYGKPIGWKEDDKKFKPIGKEDLDYVYWMNGLNQRIYLNSSGGSIDYGGYHYEAHFVEVAYMNMTVFDDEYAEQKKVIEEYNREKAIESQKNAKLKDSQDI